MRLRREYTVAQEGEEQPAETSRKTAKLCLLPANARSPASSNKATSPYPKLPIGFTWYLLLSDFLLEKVVVSWSGNLNEFKGERCLCIQLYLLSFFFFKHQTVHPKSLAKKLQF